MKNLIFVLFIFACSTTVYSQANWVFYSETENTRWYVDKNSILVNTSDESELKVWLKCEKIVPEYNEINKLYIEKLLVEEVIYCNSRMHQTLGMTAFFT